MSVAIRTMISGDIAKDHAMGLTCAQVAHNIVWLCGWCRALSQHGSKIVQMMHASALAVTAATIEIPRLDGDVFTNDLKIPEGFWHGRVFHLGLTMVLTALFCALKRHFLCPLGPPRQCNLSARSIERACPCMNPDLPCPVAVRGLAIKS